MVDGYFPSIDIIRRLTFDIFFNSVVVGGENSHGNLGD